MGNTIAGDSKHGKLSKIKKVKGKRGRIAEPQFTDIAEEAQTHSTKTDDPIATGERRVEVIETPVKTPEELWKKEPGAPDAIISPPSQESSSESHFTDPLLTPMEFSAEINECYYSQESVLGTPQQDLSHQPLNSFKLNEYKARREELNKKLSKLSVSETSRISVDSEAEDADVEMHEEDDRRDRLNGKTADCSTDSGNQSNDYSDVGQKTNRISKRLSEVNLPTVDFGQNREYKRHMSVSAATPISLDECNQQQQNNEVLKKVASLTFTIESKVTKPKFVPEKLDFQLYEKFEGHMLINWYISEFKEDHYLKLLNSNQDLKVLAVQFCTHLLAAGVLRQIPDKDVPMYNIFKPDLMYYWAHTETPAPVPDTPGKLSQISWPPMSPCEPNVFIENNETPSPKTPEPYFERPKELRPAAKDAEILSLEEENKWLKQELDKYKTLIEIQTLTANAVKDFSSPLEEEPNKICDIDDNSNKKFDGGEDAEKLPDPVDRFIEKAAVYTQTSPSSHVEKGNFSAQTVIKQDTINSAVQTIINHVRVSSDTQTMPTENYICGKCLENNNQSRTDLYISELKPAIASVLSQNLASSPGLDAAVMSGFVAPPPPPMLNISGLPPPSPMVELEGPVLKIGGPQLPPMPGIDGLPSAPLSPSMCGISIGGPPPPPPPPMPGMGGPPPPPMPGMGGPPPPPMPGMGGPPPPPMPGMGGPPPPPMPGMGGPPPPPMPGMGCPPPPPMPGMGGPPPPPMPGMSGPPPMGVPAGFGPPPPPPMGGPTPLPTPPVGGWNANRAMAPPPSLFPAMRKQPVNPSVPMKPLYWTRILVPQTVAAQAAADCTDGAAAAAEPLWLKLDEVRLENMSEFTDLFSRQVIKCKPSKKKATAKLKTEAVKLLDSKRSQNVGILAQSLHVDFQEIENAIYNLDTNVVSLEALQQIYEARANAEELEIIKAHQAAKPEIPLDKPEQFLYELSEISNFAERISCFMFNADFDDSITGIEHILVNIKSTCKFLTTNNNLSEILAIILTLGNYMNGGNMARGQADGFGLEILSKLKDVKSKDSQITLLHFIVRIYFKKIDNPLLKSVPLPVPEPGDIERAACVNFDDVDLNLKELQKKLQACENKTQKVIDASTPENLQPFKEKMSYFLENAKKRLTVAFDDLKECKIIFVKTMTFYHFKPKSGTLETFPPNDFFELWKMFCIDFKNIWKKEFARLEKERIDELKRKELERRSEHVTIKKRENGLKAKIERMKAKQSK